MRQSSLRWSVPPLAIPRILISYVALPRGAIASSVVHCSEDGAPRRRRSAARAPRSTPPIPAALPHRDSIRSASARGRPGRAGEPALLPSLLKKEPPPSFDLPPPQPPRPALPSSAPSPPHHRVGVPSDPCVFIAAEAHRAAEWASAVGAA